MKYTRRKISSIQPRYRMSGAILLFLTMASPLHTLLSQTGLQESIDSLSIRISLVKTSEVEHNPVWLKLQIQNQTEKQIIVRNLSRILNDNIILVTSRTFGPVEKASRIISVHDPLIAPRKSMVLYLSLNNHGSLTSSPLTRYLPVDHYEVKFPVFTMINDNAVFSLINASESLCINPLDPENSHLQHSIASIESDTLTPDRWKLILAIIEQYPKSQLIPRFLKSLYECARTDPDDSRQPEIAKTFEKMIQRFPDDPATIDMLRWITKVNAYGGVIEAANAYIPFLRSVSKKHRNRIVGEYARYSLERIANISPEYLVSAAVPGSASQETIKKNRSPKQDQSR